MLSTNRNDFTATLICEHCNNEQHLGSGYNDGFYHEKVLPSITCRSCNKDRSGTIPPEPNHQGEKSISD